MAPEVSRWRRNSRKKPANAYNLKELQVASYILIFILINWSSHYYKLV